MTRLYFDTEFTGLKQKTTLISIGIVSENGRQFYAEFRDYDRSMVDSWISENVISKLKHTDFFAKHKKENYHEFQDRDNGRYEVEVVYGNQLPKEFNFSVNDSTIYECAGSKAFVAEMLKRWISQFGKCELYSDVYAYDWVLFCDLFGGALNIPENVYYIPQDLATSFRQNGIDPDISRAEFADASPVALHNALADAWMIKGCFEKIESLKNRKNVLS